MCRTVDREVHIGQNKFSSSGRKFVKTILAQSDYFPQESWFQTELWWKQRSDDFVGSILPTKFTFSFSTSESLPFPNKGRLLCH